MILRLARFISSSRTVSSLRQAQRPIAGLILVVGLLLVMEVASCSKKKSTGPGSGGPVTTKSVSIGNSFFSPPDIQIAIGDTVTWTYAAGQITHNVVGENGLFNSGDMPQTKTVFKHVFSSIGTFRYRCTYHSTSFTSGMVGSVTVR